MTDIAVLIVEDDDTKFDAILKLVREAADEAVIQRAGELGTARRLLRATRFDLLILDIAIPTLAGRSASPDAGAQLLEELEHGDHLRMPTHIVGLTAFEDVVRDVGPRFASRTVSLVYYDPTSSDWSHALRSRVWFSLRTKAEESSAARRFETDLAIVCALPDPELRAVLRNGWTWTLDRKVGDPTVYHQARFTTRSGEKTAVAAAACQMGMTATAVLAMKMTLQYRPQYIAMAGITAAREGQASLGDILVANPTWDWGSGKISASSDGGESNYENAPSQLTLRASVRERLVYLAGQTSSLEAIRQAWHEPPVTGLRLLIGPVPSGSSVVQDDATMERIRKQHRKLLGVEMEGYGIHVAAEEAPDPQPTAFVMKSVVDFGVPGKNDVARSYASFTSARLLRLFAEEYLWGDMPPRQ